MSAIPNQTIKENSMSTFITHYVKPLLITTSFVAMLSSPTGYAVQPIEQMKLQENSQATITNEEQAQKYQKRYKAHKRNGAASLRKMAIMLDLSQDQQDQIIAIKQATKLSSVDFRMAMKAFRSEVKVLMQAEYFDEQAFTQLQSRYQPTFAQVALMKAKTKHAIAKVLTVEQRAKWFQLRKMQKGHGAWGGKPSHVG
jgi:protein CpxP